MAVAEACEGQRFHCEKGHAMTEPAKPDCYKCAWRRNVPGDCHSSCARPTLDIARTDPFNKLMAVLCSARNIPVSMGPPPELTVTGNTHGISQGWFNWPYNFDPRWLETCNGFTPKREACKTCEGALLCVVNEKEPIYAGYNSKGQAVTRRTIRARKGESSELDDLPAPPECWKDHERDKGSAYDKDYTEVNSHWAKK